MSYYVWIRETEEGEPVEVGHGPYTLEKAKAFARIGSLYGGPRIVTRGRDGNQVRKYSGGARTWPTVNKQLTGFLEEEVPKQLEKDVKNPQDSSWLWVAAGVGAAAAFIAGAIKGIVSRQGVPNQTGPVRLVGGIATGPTGYSFTITQQDKELLAQALVGEVAEGASRWNDPEVQRGGAAVLWALLQLHMLWKSRTGTIPRMSSFQALIRSYAQPVNPEWSVPEQGRCVDHPEKCTPRIIARRQRIQSYTWNTVPAQVRDLINRWTAGQVPNPVPGMVDYAHYRFNGDQVNIADNNFGTLPWRQLA